MVQKVPDEVLEHLEQKRAACWQLEGLVESNMYSSLYMCDKLCFPSFSVIRLLLYLPTSSFVSQIIIKLSSSLSSSYFFHFRHLFFNGIMKEAVSYQNMTIYEGYYLEVPSPVLSITCSLVILYNNFIFSFLLQHHISNFPKYFRFNFFMSLMFSALFKSDIFV